MAAGPWKRTVPEKLRPPFQFRLTNRQGDDFTGPADGRLKRLRMMQKDRLVPAHHTPAVTELRPLAGWQRHQDRTLRNPAFDMERKARQVRANWSRGV